MNDAPLFTCAALDCVEAATQQRDGVWLCQAHADEHDSTTDVLDSFDDVYPTLDEFLDAVAAAHLAAPDDPDLEAKRSTASVLRAALAVRLEERRDELSRLRAAVVDLEARAAALRMSARVEVVEALGLPADDASEWPALLQGIRNAVDRDGERARARLGSRGELSITTSAGREVVSPDAVVGATDRLFGLLLANAAGPSNMVRLVRLAELEVDELREDSREAVLASTALTSDERRSIIAHVHRGRLFLAAKSVDAIHVLSSLFPSDDDWPRDDDGTPYCSTTIRVSETPLVFPDDTVEPPTHVRRPQQVRGAK